MYVWNISELRAQLSKGDLTEPDAMKYLMANTVMYSLAMIQYSNPNGYDTLGGFIGLLVAIGGLMFIYRSNGGEDGKHFVHRYLAIGWVVLVRFLVLVVVPASVISTLVLELYFDGVVEETTAFDVLFMNVGAVIYVWLVSRHINSVARGSA